MGRTEVLGALIAEVPAVALRRVLLGEADATGRAGRARGRTTSRAKISRFLAATSPSVTPVKPAGRRQHDAAPSPDAMTDWLGLRERVQAAQQAAGLTIGQLGEAVGYAHTTVRLALGRRQPPSAPIQVKLDLWADAQGTKAPEGAATAPFRAGQGNGAAATRIGSSATAST